MSPLLKRLAFTVTGLLILAGLVSTAAHYGPAPPLENLNDVVVPGVEWFLYQMPRYAEHYLMTFLHVVPAFMFMVLTPVQLVPAFRRKESNVHRRSGRIFVVVNVVVLLSGLTLGFVMPFAGAGETIVSMILGGVFAWCLAMGVYCIRKKNITGHRLWMSRMLAAGFAPVTMRVLFGAGIVILDLDAREIFAVCLFAGLVINMLVVELWLRFRRAGMHDKSINDFALRAPINQG